MTATAATTRLAALAGALAAAVAFATAALADALSGSVPSLVAVVDQALIRAIPGALVRTGIDSAGTANKPLLAFGTVALGLALGAIVGREARRRPVVGDAAFAVFGLLAIFCATRLPTVSVSGAIVGALTAVVSGAITLRALLAASERDTDSPTPAGPGHLAPQMPGTHDRRHFLLAGSIATFGAALAFAGSRSLRGGGQTASRRAAIRLPAPAEPAGPAAGTGEALVVDKLSPLITPTPDFFRIDEALIVPSVDVDTWRLRVTGMVDAPFELSFEQILAMPLIERDITLSCVSNEVGGPLVGNGRWLGVRLSDLLERAQVQPGATQLVGRSVDRFTVGFPTSVALDGRDAMVAVGQNGEPLTPVHGYPARLVVPGLYGYVSATKWLREIQLTTWEAFDAYWIERGWAEEAPVKVQSRIDVPRDFAQANAGPQTAAGVAWAPNRGIARVEIRVGNGPWRETRLGPSLGDDSWRQWVSKWEAPPGNHVLYVRATTNDGEVQTDYEQGSFPDGASGHHKVNVRVAARN